ncbi:CDC45-like protein [Mya arenaria]|uniref:CDC45-like protein n=1 Tax=Mya arenaria TaxID=6604 RepID=A0ABY7E0E1_MYAAR|nr:CDC45-like protein [Mya arenaria]
MIIKDFRKEFYDVIQHQSLFQCDQILYTIVPVAGKEDLERSYLENSEGIRHVVMINCGSNIDIIETLQPEEYIKFYICDSHRPVDVHNLYNAVQVKLLMRSSELSVPEYDEVFRDDDNSDEEDSGNDSDTSESATRKRKRFDDAAIERRMERRKWEENRVKVLFDYMQFSTYGTSSALLMFELAWKMSKDSNDLLWLAIIGVTDQYVHYKTGREKYIEDVMALQSHVSRLNHKDDEEIISINCLKIQYDDELHLSLYRHWSLFESLCHSINMACKFKVWTLKGQKRLNEFLAEMGLVDEDVILPSFFAQYGFKNKLCATDVTYVTAAILENYEKGASSTDCFLKAMDVLSRSNTSAMEKGIDLARRQLQAVIAQVQTFLDMHQVISAGPFLYAFMQESRNKKCRNLPLVLGVPQDSEHGTVLVIGIPPLSMDDERKNFFGKAFEQAATSTNCRTIHNYFDTFMMELKSDDRSKFFDSLISLLN